MVPRAYQKKLAGYAPELVSFHYIMSIVSMTRTRCGDSPCAKRVFEMSSNPIEKLIEENPITNKS